MNSYNCLVVLGPTASGKTRLACQLALRLRGAVISADSRQVYKTLDLGTGKDLSEYTIAGTAIPYHCINIADPVQQFFLHQYTAALLESFYQVRAQGQLPLICGGTGLYLDALQKDYSYTQVPENPVLRQQLEPLDHAALLEVLQRYPAEARRHIDTQSKKRVLRGIELGEYFLSRGQLPPPQPLPYRPFYIGLNSPVPERRKRIAARLEQRLQAGLLDECRALLQRGISHQRLLELGLEYKYCALHLAGCLSESALVEQLTTAIVQFAKRQMTWFRKMEREGVSIHWLAPDDLQGALQLLAACAWETPAASGR